MNIPFDLIDWNTKTVEEKPGDSGILKIKRVEHGKLTIRILECSSNYKLDHWCFVGHVAHCLEGECVLELQNGERFHLKKGMSFCVSDNQPAHLLLSENGATLFVIDGEFLAA